MQAKTPYVLCTILTNTSVFMVTIVIFNILFLFLEVSFHIKLMLKDTINQKNKENSVIISSPSRWWKVVHKTFLELHSKNSVAAFVEHKPI